MMIKGALKSDISKLFFTLIVFNDKTKKRTPETFPMMAMARVTSIKKSVLSIAGMSPTKKFLV